MILLSLCKLCIDAEDEEELCTEGFFEAFTFGCPCHLNNYHNHLNLDIDRGIWYVHYYKY